MSKSKLRNTLLAATMVAGGLIMGTAPAHATLGTEFIGTDSLSFNCATVNPGVGVGSFVSCGSTQLVWRDAAGTTTEPVSQLNIDGASNTAVSILADMGWYTIADIQHVNTIIPGGVFNFTIDADDSFTLTDASLNPVLSLPNNPLHVAFTETPNEVLPCANPLGNNCADKFVVSNLDDVIASFPFFALGENWMMSFRILAVAAAGTEFDDANPAGGGTIWTAETNNSRLQVQAQIQQVPEPASLALLGIGLAGLGFARRAAKKADAEKA